MKRVVKVVEEDGGSLSGAVMRSFTEMTLVQEVGGDESRSCGGTWVRVFEQKEQQPVQMS